ncbi:MAG TPA: hypothetical protein VFR33_16120 [Candidatus Dormibacteraeota bacterium]|nr:hypothetical protein [Candidatus Dormibacteraeota bacterium]
MRGFVLGIVLLGFLAFGVLALRPGGIRRQLRLVARRFRIVLVLGGVYVFGSLVIRVLVTSGPVNEWGPVALAMILAVVFLFVAGDPAT